MLRRLAPCNRAIGHGAGNEAHWSLDPDYLPALMGGLHLPAQSATVGGLSSYRDLAFAGETFAETIWMRDTMNPQPQTVHDAMHMLQSYHQQRCDTYRRMTQDAPDEWTKILLDELVQLEEQAAQVVEREIDRLDPKEKSYLLPGVIPTFDPAHAMDCQCDSDPDFKDVLSCSLNSSGALDELIDLIAASNAAQSVQDLASRLRELEQSRERQIAKFTRLD